MLKKIATTFLTLGLASAWGLCLAPPAKAQVDDNDAIIKVVNGFYEKYDRAFSGDTPVDLTAFLKQQPEADEALARKIALTIKEAEESEMGFLDYDPILLAQDFPEGREYAKAAICGQSATLVAYNLWSGGVKSPFCVTLVKKNGLWLISDLRGMENEADGCDCGG